MKKSVLKNAKVPASYSDLKAQVFNLENELEIAEMDNKTNMLLAFLIGALFAYLGFVFVFVK